MPLVVIAGGGTGGSWLIEASTWSSMALRRAAPNERAT